jgi:hypothetical protein
MHPSGINSVYGMQARYLFWYSRSCYFMYQSPKTGILLWRPANYRERPYRILAVINIMHFHQRERDVSSCNNPNDRQKGLRVYFRAALPCRLSQNQHLPKYKNLRHHKNNGSGGYLMPRQRSFLISLRARALPQQQGAMAGRLQICSPLSGCPFALALV